MWIKSSDWDENSRELLTEQLDRKINVYKRKLIKVWGQKETDRICKSMFRSSLHITADLFL